MRDRQPVHLGGYARQLGARSIDDPGIARAPPELEQAKRYVQEQHWPKMGRLRT